MDQALNQKIDAFIAANKEQILQDIAALVAINSVEGECSRRSIPAAMWAISVSPA